MSTDLAIAPDQKAFTQQQASALVHLGVSGASDGDLQVFFHVVQRTGLDPFARQIYMIERQGKQTIQTGIDGYRLIARRAADKSGHSYGISAAQWCADDGVWRGIWPKAAGHPTAARVVVTRQGEPFEAVAMWDEYAQTKRDGGLTSMWATRGAGQLAKCAEALALRKAFPLDLSGIYVDAEMDQASNHYEAPSVVDGPQRPAGAARLRQPAPPQPQPVGMDDVIDQAPSARQWSDLTAAMDAAGIPQNHRAGHIERVLGEPRAPEQLDTNDVDTLIAIFRAEAEAVRRA